MAATASNGALISLRETRLRLSISEATLFRLIRRGDLPVIELGGRTLVDPADLDRLISARRRRRSPQPAKAAS